MEIIEYFFGAIFFSIALFPVAYIFYKRGKNKLFYLSACIGVYVFIELLIFAIFLPAGILLEKVAPQLGGQELIFYMRPLLYVLDFIQEWQLIISYPFLAIWLPLAIYRRYSIFHITSQTT